MEEERSFCMAAKHWKRSLGVWMTGAMMAMSMSTAYASTTAKTVKDQVNVRKNASTGSEVLTTLAKGESVTIQSQDGDWCKVSIGKKTGYIRNDMLDQKAESTDKTTTKTAAKTSSETTADISTVYAAKESVNLRDKPSTSGNVLQQVNYGETITVTGKSGEWYEVEIPAQEKVAGYVRSDMVSTTELPKAVTPEVITTGGVGTIDVNAIAEEVSTTSTEQKSDIYINTGDNTAIATDASAPAAATSTVLSTQKAQEYLKELGFYHDSADGSSGKVTMAAIKAFQTAYDLTIDGELGAETSAAIQQAAQRAATDPSVKEVNAAKVRVSPNGVVLSEWFNGMKYMFPKYEHLRVVDVQTGEEFKLRAFSLGNHADVEPPTKEDTNTLYRINGYKWSWTPRPIWVYIGDQVYAASINVQPHGPDTIADNGMKGQICMHFLYSRQHNTGQENKNLQAAIWTAFEQSSNAPAPGTSNVTPVQTEVKPLNLSEEDLFALVEEESN